MRTATTITIFATVIYCSVNININLIISIGKMRKISLIAKAQSCFYQFSQQNKAKFDFTKNYYQILEVDKNSSKAKIRNSYLSLAKKYHPDLNDKGKQKFTIVQEAYQVLSNEKLRKEYDRQAGFGDHKETKNQGYASENRGWEWKGQRGKSEDKKKTGFQQEASARENRKRRWSDGEMRAEYGQYLRERAEVQRRWAEGLKQYQELQRRRKEWQKQASIFFGEKQELKKQKTPEQVEYGKVQHNFSDKNPFWNICNTHKILSHQEEENRNKALKEFGLDGLWKKIKEKIEK